MIYRLLKKKYLAVFLITIYLNQIFKLIKFLTFFFQM